MHEEKSPMDAGAADAFVGTELGDYLIESRLGQGGMGAVYRARDLAIPRPVALKVMLGHLAADSEGRARFQREIRNAAAIEHPNVVPIYNAGFEGGHFFIAMRLIDGPDLAEILRGGPLEPARAIERFVEIASALQRVHREGLIHRDVKPANILIAEADSRHEYALLSDFGISKALDGATNLTRGMVGTAEYSAPEILRWLPAVPQSDQYSLACVLFEMLAGRSPFQGMDLPSAHLNEPVPDPPLSAGAEVAAALRRALGKDPDERFSTMSDFASACMARAPAPRPPARTPSPRAAVSGDVRERPTLHTELVSILSGVGNRWMTAKELARSVNERGAYTKRDGSTVSGSQVRARTRQYKDLFETNGARVRLRSNRDG
jgi:serine/threonine protein kinase